MAYMQKEGILCLPVESGPGGSFPRPYFDNNFGIRAPVINKL